MAIPKKVRELLEKLLVGEESSPGRAYAVAPLMEMLRDDEMTKEDKEHLIRYYNFRKRFLDTGRGDPYPDDHHDTRLVVDVPGDTFRDIVPILLECLNYAGEDLEDFLWVLDEDEKAGRAPEDVNERRAVYKQLQPDYADEAKRLSERLEKLDNPFITTYPLSKATLIGYLETALSLLEVYQAMFDYLMSGDGSDQPDAEKERSPRETDFSAMYELFKNKKNNLPS
ncbi:MAG: hypothetical protein II435_02030 [Bacteroidales bacterium]|jgi:hypothetical protein|nr:hypothetical protein [Bacteroidales bacterium]MBQ2148704.1 hypothetical protein [Bacteroidales bacterium]MBQ2193990.1 hypothetical protein [Bacteroidales bacterium]MBQ3743573.1 hypothetical protein [Bacteroidales bacterium]MBR3485661.1 hypothetical protein [Bacteroidales bacterium]